MCSIAASGIYELIQVTEDCGEISSRCRSDDVGTLDMFLTENNIHISILKSVFSYLFKCRKRLLELKFFMGNSGNIFTGVMNKQVEDAKVAR